MNRGLKATLVGAACLICCLPLIFAVVGATTGIIGAVGVWVGRYDLALLGALGLIAVIAMAVRRNRTASRPKTEYGDVFTLRVKDQQTKDRNQG